MIVHRTRYIIICMSCLRWNSTRSSRQDTRRRTGDGRRRISLETISPPIRSGPSFPHYLCKWARRLSLVKLAVILRRSMCGYTPGTRYVKWLHTKYQAPKINIWYRGINLFFFFGGFGLVGLCFFFSLFGETKYCTPYIVILWVTAVVRFIYFLGDIDPEAWVTVLIVGICWWLHSVWQATVDLQRYSF